MKDWLGKIDPKWLVQQGVGWAFLGLALYWVANNMVLPAQNANIKLQEATAATNKINSETLSRQTIILERIEDHLKR